MRVGEAPNRLAIYGTLAPGEENHWVIARLQGKWLRGVVRGHLYHAGWGATKGFPAMLYDASGDEIAVQVLEAETLTAHWPRIDEFEGPEYRRVVVPVAMESGEVLDCCIYEWNRQ